MGKICIKHSPTASCFLLAAISPMDADFLAVETQLSPGGRGQATNCERYSVVFGMPLELLSGS